MAMKRLRAKARGAKYSRLVWLGLAVAVSGYLETQFRTIEVLIPERWRGPALMLLGLVVVVLRFMTTAPLDQIEQERHPPPEGEQ